MRQIDFICKQCKKRFISKSACRTRQPIYCSIKCYGLTLAKWKKCLTCGERFYYWANKLYCSNKCKFRAMVGRPLSLKHRQALSIAKKGKPQPQINTPEVRRKISVTLTGKPQPWNRNEKHHAWKGEGAGYTAFHQWLKRYYGVASKCENRHSKRPAHRHPKRFEWALIHGEEHAHDRTRYQQLCASCHRIYDRKTI